MAKSINRKKRTQRKRKKKKTMGSFLQWTSRQKQRAYVEKHLQRSQEVVYAIELFSYHGRTLFASTRPWPASFLPARLPP